MLGQPDPVFPIRTKDGSAKKPEFSRPGFVSLWAATFPSIEEAEAYFGIPDEIGVSLPPDAFVADLGVDDIAPDNLEVNFEQIAPRPIADLLQDATFAASYVGPALAAANEQGVGETQGVAMLFDYDYRLKPGWQRIAGPLHYIGTFPYARFSRRMNLEIVRQLAAHLHCRHETLVFLLVAFWELTAKRRKERGDNIGHITGRELCDHLLTRQGEDSRVTLREVGLLHREEVGRLIFGVVAAKVIRATETDSQADFRGLFNLE
jgi:uncharacterized repeat protein (TIGR04138 family)